MVLPCEDNGLRQRALDRVSCRVARYEVLPLDIERAVSSIIEREVELIRRLDVLKRDLEARFDYSAYGAFKTIDRCADGYVNSFNLSTFLRNQCYYPTDSEVLAIIRRMDTSCLAKVSYSDFADFLRNYGSANLCPSPIDLCRPRSCGRSSPIPTVRSSKRCSSAYNGRRASASSPKKKKACCSDCEDGKKCAGETKKVKKACCSDCEDGKKCAGETKSTSKVSYDSLCRPYVCIPEVRCSPVRAICSPVRTICSPVRDLCSPVRTAYKPVCDPCRPLCDPCKPLCDPCDPCRPLWCPPYCKPAGALLPSQERELVQALYEMIKEERELESAKITLANRCDFNLYDAFKIFDVCSRGYVTLHDLREGLAAIGVYPTTSDLELYLKRYDKFNEGKVRFAEFSNSFTPKTDSCTSSALNRRRSNYWAGRCCAARDECFEPGTRIEFRATWNTHFKVEAHAEGLRQRLRSLPCFDLYSAFLSCDLYNDGVISKEELRRLIDCHGFCITDNDARQLVDKMDKNKDGFVSYGEVRN